MGRLITVISPDAPSWSSLGRFLSVYGIEMSVSTERDFLARSEARSGDTVILIDTDEYTDRSLNLISAIMKTGHIGVIALSCEMSRQERIVLTCMGVDHCLLRPVDEQELSAIVNNMFRRSEGAFRNLGDRQQDHSSWTLDLNKWSLRTPTGHDIYLSPSEMSVLAIILRSPGMPQLRRDLNGGLTNYSKHCDGRSLDVLISRLRRKVRDASSMKLPLRSARGTGYVFTSSAKIIPN